MNPSNIKLKNPLISFVILTWNSEKIIRKCLKSISNKCNQENIVYKIYIIDNGSSDRTVKFIQDFSRKLPIELTKLDSNRGTTFSRNIGLKRCEGKIICILDSDTEIKSGSIRKIVSLFQDKTIGIVAPRLVLPDGTIQNSVKKFPSLLNKMLKIPKIIFKIKIKDYDFYDGFPFHCVTDVDTAISACWFLKRKLIEEIGMFDEKIFYSPEDIDFCLRVKKINKRIVYYPYFTTLHYTQQISHKKIISKITLSHFLGLMYYFIKHRYFKRPKL